MQVLFAPLLLILSVLPFAAPAPAGFTPSATASTIPPRANNDYEQPRISEVILKMEQTLGELDWKPTSDGGKLLIVPSKQWDDYVSKFKSKPELKHKRALQKRSTEIYGGFQGHYAEVGCYPTGTEADPRTSNYTEHVAAACSGFNYGNLTATYDQTTLSEVTTSSSGEPMQWWFKFKNFAKISQEWNEAECRSIMWDIVSLCAGEGGVTQGGWIDVWAGATSEERGEWAYSYTSDPNKGDCLC